jgi:anthranilate phosphoribosyltransferase
MNFLRENATRFDSNQSVPPDDCIRLFDELINSKDVSAIAACLDSWSKKGATADELFGFATIMRERAQSVTSKHTELVDIVGTGGSQKKIFNVSTAASFVAAGAGLKIAKHGNRAASSKTGSADVLSEIGIGIETEPARVGEILDLIGICFMFAPKFHRLSKELATARKSLNKPTVFNQLGPIVNPAGAPFQLIGVWNKDVLKPMSDAVSRLGTRKTWLVFGADGLDEITLEGPTFVSEIEAGTVRQFEVSPSDFGIRETSLAQFSDVSPARSAEIIRRVLEGSSTDEPETLIVILNAAAAIYIGGLAETLKSAADMARESIRTGSAHRVMTRLAEETSR